MSCTAGPAWLLRRAGKAVRRSPFGMAHAPGGAGVYGQGGGEWLKLMITAGLSDFTEGMQRGTVHFKKRTVPL
jgi:hypothetical protein